MRPFFLRKYLRLVCWASLSIVLLACGSLAAGLLFSEENDTNAVLLFVAALLGADGCIFFFYCCLRQISSKPKEPFISTLH
jgi:hypothetical protein